MDGLAEPIEVTDQDWELLKGAVDQHVHSGPAILPREIDHLEEMREASAAGLAAVLFKDHYYPTGAMATLLGKHFADLGVKPMSGIALNNTVGGFNHFAVEHEALLGGRIVWLPTVSAANHIRYAEAQAKAFDHPSKMSRMSPETPVLAFDGKVIRDDVKAVLDAVAKHDMVLSGGHLHISEIWTVFEEAKRRGVNRFLLNHPESIIEASFNDVGGLASFGCIIEHSMTRFVPSSKFQKYTLASLKQHIDTAGVDNTILASDMGQKGSATPVRGMVEAVGLCRTLGYTPDEIRKMISDNPKRLLGI